MLCVWKACKSHRWRDWYLCLGHINHVRITKQLQAEMKAQKMELELKPGRRGGGDGGNRVEYLEPKSVAAVAGS